MTFDPEFKKALQLLPEAEKDKLILRLLKHDLKLANQLQFALLETESVQDKRDQLAKRISKRIVQITQHYYLASFLITDIRDISGQINEHVYITKDKVGEISLNCLMLRNLLELNNERIASEKYSDVYPLCIYIVARIFKILILLQKQHEDLHIEFRDDIETIGMLMGKNPHLMKTAIYNGLDVNWLIEFEIPKNITDIYKELRNNGLLR